MSVFSTSSNHRVWEPFQFPTKFRSPSTDVWIWSLAGQTLTRLTFDAAVDQAPLWTPDSARVVFRSSREGGGLFWKAADGTGEIERLMEGTNNPVAFSWAADGRLVFDELGLRRGQLLRLAMTGGNIGVLTVEGEPNRDVLLDSEFGDQRPAVSPEIQSRLSRWGRQFSWPTTEHEGA